MTMRQKRFSYFYCLALTRDLWPHFRICLTFRLLGIKWWHDALKVLLLLSRSSHYHTSCACGDKKNRIVTENHRNDPRIHQSMKLGINVWVGVKNYRLGVMEQINDGSLWHALRITHRASRLRWSDRYKLMQLRRWQDRYQYTYTGRQSTIPPTSAP